MLNYKPEKLTTLLLLIGALSFLPTLFFYLVGEEGIYVITAMETWQRHTWMQEIMYGVDDMRPPLLNWITMPLAELIGWTHLVFVVRLVSVSATLGTIGWLYWLSRKLFGEKSFALFAALTTLALADLLLYRGWLSYTDPVFAFFTFGAMATLWVACLEQHRGWLLLSVLLVGCALLTKAFTSYIFYGTAGVVLFVLQRDTRRFFLSPSVWLIFALALIVPVVWFSSIPRSENSAFMFDEIMRKLSVDDVFGYLKHLAEFPLEMFVRLSPAVLLAAYLLLRKRVTTAEISPLQLRTAALIAGLCFLPYWLSPQNSVRYILPIYPIIALVSARIIWRAGESAQVLALRWFAGIIAFKFLLALVLFPYYQTHYRGENFEKTADVVIGRTHGFPLYIKDTRSVGLAITAYIDMKRFPQPPLTYPPELFDSGFVLAMDANPLLGEVTEIYPLAADRIFLLCRGAACATRTDK
jgi:4-amino-4-deoxy-L-arabinose transferase-like glycosyltransferase